MSPPNPWLQYLVFPIVVGLVVLLGQFIVQPRIAARQHFDQTKWDARRALYAQALRIVNEKFASIGDWGGADVPGHAKAIAPQPPPSVDAVNHVYAELALFTSKEILRAFLACFGVPGVDITAEKRFQLVTLMRQDLGLGKIEFDESDTFFFLRA